MDPQEKLYELFLRDTYSAMRAQGYDAVEAVMRLRLYITVTGYRQTLRDLYLEGGFSSADYDRFLAAYNRRLAHRMT